MDSFRDLKMVCPGARRFYTERRSEARVRTPFHLCHDRGPQATIFSVDQTRENPDWHVVGMRHFAAPPRDTFIFIAALGPRLIRTPPELPAPVGRFLASPQRGSPPSCSSM